MGLVRSRGLRVGGANLEAVPANWEWKNSQWVGPVMLTMEVDRTNLGVAKHFAPGKVRLI